MALPTDVADMALELFDSALPDGGASRATEMDASQRLIWPDIREVLEIAAGKDEAFIRSLINTIKAGFLGGNSRALDTIRLDPGMVVASPFPVARVTDADAHQLRTLLSIIALLEPFAAPEPTDGVWALGVWAPGVWGDNVWQGNPPW